MTLTNGQQAPRAWLSKRKPDNYYDNIGPPTAIAQLVFLSFMFVLLLLRLYHRHAILQPIGPDDFMIALGAVITIALVGVHCKCRYRSYAYDGDATDILI